jgi:N-hydroxyarylamine O-acetyltransferase
MPSRGAGPLAPGRAPTGAACARVLVLGRAPEVLETVMREVADAGCMVTGSIESERAAEQFDARDFELIAFGRGLAGPLSERLKQAFTRQNPQIRLLDTFAPLAAWQIVAALDGGRRQPQVDLDAYCARIGYRGPRTPTLDTLRALHALHPASIVFEAIDVLLDRGVDLSHAAVDTKLIGSRRGGYCYEHGSLFARVLTAIGFEVEMLVGCVHWMKPPGDPPRPRTHKALRVVIDDEPWLADVGFGGAVSSAPLRMDFAEQQPTAHEPFRVIPFGDGLLVQSLHDGRWQSLYELSQEPQLLADYEVPNWFTATHPSSHFRQRLIVSRTTPEARHTLLNGRLTVRRPGGKVERQVLDADRIERALQEVFDLPVEAGWRPIIERAAAAGA